MSTLASIALWFQKAFPHRNQVNRTSQIGVHFEEVCEMIAEIEGLDGETRVYLALAKMHLQNLSNHFKEQKAEYTIPDPALFLDSLCDQVVTATGVAHNENFAFAQAMYEVNASNWSKFSKEGEPIYNEHGKIMKGPNYVKPDLANCLEAV